MAVPAAAVRDLRAARRRHRTEEVHWIDALYRAYLTAIGAGITVVVASSVVGDAEVRGEGLASVLADGPAVVGLAVAVALAVGARSGRVGGPLSLSAPDVHHVLMAPIDRAAVLRGQAVRLARFAAFAGGVVGAVAGEVASHRLPGDTVAWVLAGAAAGAITAAGAVGVALAVSGARLSPPLAFAVVAACVGWAVADVLGPDTSPFSLAGRLALAPVTRSWAAAGAVVVAAVPLAAGLALVGRSSLEAAARRTSLVRQLRFAVTLQDLRTAVVLRRQLLQERPRRRPWAPVPRLGRLPVCRRGLQGLARWPGVRIARVLVLAGVAGLCLRGAWSGTTPLAAVAGLALYAAGLDAVEALAQEADHPGLTSTFPEPIGVLTLWHLAVPTALLVVVAAVAAGVGSVGGSPSTVLAAAGPAVLPAAVAVAVAAAATVVLGGQDGDVSALGVAQPEMLGSLVLLRMAWPPGLAVAATAPVVVAREAGTLGMTTAAASAVTAGAVLLLTAPAVVWLRLRIADDGRRRTLSGWMEAQAR
jgi:hypothetical protein